LSERDTQSGTLPLGGAVILALLATAATLLGTHCLSGNLRLSVGWILQLVTDLGQLALLIIAAGGIGYLVVRKLLPTERFAGLAVITAIGLGFWILATLVLVVGTVSGGMLNGWVWWPLTVLGVLAALWQSRHSLADKVLPKRLDGRSLIWVILAVAGALWVSGATCPPGWCQLGGDGYDVLEYHLQVPREYLAAQHIGPLWHNCYSFFPMGTEMLYLLAMVLRGGAYEGMYLANLIQGVYLALAVAAVFCSLRREDDAHGRFSAVLLGTAPLLLYLSYLAMVELSAVFYLVLALLWLRQWLKAPDWKSAAMIGLVIGGACATKYLAVGLVAAPVLAVMLAAAVMKKKVPPSEESLLNRERKTIFSGKIGQVMLAGVLSVVMLSPWLIRNTVYTGNPVFPLATDILGRGHWSAQSQERFQAGHGRANFPPVPPPAGVHLPPPVQEDRLKDLFNNFLGDSEFALPLIVLTMVSACWILAGGGGAWERTLLAVLVMQVALWAAVAHDMPPRFLAIAIVPMTLLSGGLLARLSRVAKNPLRKNAPSSGGRWGLSAAAVILVVAALVNLVTAGNMLDNATRQPTIRYCPGDQIAQANAEWLGLPRDSKVVLLGESEAFYFQSNVVYATVFDSDGTRPVPLGKTPQETLQNLRKLGVTHVLVNWDEMVRLGETYGFPAAYTGDLFDRRQNGGPIGLPCLDNLGLVPVRHIQLPIASAAASQPTSTSSPATAPADTTEFRGDHFRWSSDHRLILPAMSLYQLPLIAIP
jgi:hypothetical protein